MMPYSAADAQTNTGCPRYLKVSQPAAQENIHHRDFRDAAPQRRAGAQESGSPPADTRKINF